MQAQLLSCALLFSLVGTSLAQESTRPAIRGEVRDQTGLPVAGATVELRGEGCNGTARTDQAGSFQLDGPAAGCTLVVSASGFAAYTEPLTARTTDAAPLQITLAPAAFNERVTVTAARVSVNIGDTPQSARTLSDRELLTTAAPTLDDALRQIVGFALFRRAGSRTANPTSQGVSLRGVGASGASRALVLVDGVPLNDPFGGWIYWGRVPTVAIERVEVLRGAASDLYGSSALGGVVQIITRRPERPIMVADASLGNRGTGMGSLFAGGRWRNWGLALSAEGFRTDGYVLVDENARGPVDVAAGVRRSTFETTVDRKFGERGSIFLRGSYFAERRSNGTPLQTNQTRTRQLSAGGRWASVERGDFDLRAYLSAQVYDQNFSAVAAGRRSETLTRVQRSPSQASGAALQWTRTLQRQTLVAGAEARDVRGASDETIFSGGRPTSLAGAGGKQRTASLFAEDLIRITPRAIIAAALRYDRWRNFDALRVTRPVATPRATVDQLVEREEAAVSPRLSLLYRLDERLALAASVYRAFRAPTLNELYRSFRVGDVLTLANPDLRAERLTGGEAGASYTRAAFSTRAVLFWSEISRPIANVTIATAPTLITRQRQNLGRTRARGLEVEAGWRPTARWSIDGGYMFVAATVVRFPANRALEGLRVPQVPAHQLTLQSRYATSSGWSFAAQARASSAQFDDDQNLFRLGSYFTLDLFGARKLRRGLEVFAAVENVFDARYDIGRTPVRTTGPPRLVRFGVRFAASAR